MRFLFTFLLTVLSPYGISADCSEENLMLSTQGDVDSFQDVFGPCDTVTGNLVISGSMSNLDGLLNLNRVSGDMTIEESIDLNDISGIRNLRYIGGDLTVVNNSSLSNAIQIGDDIDGEADEDQSGKYVVLNSDGSVLAVGAAFNDGNGNDSGHVRVFDWNGNKWAQRGNDIDGEAAGDQSGTSISISDNGDVIAIGSKYNDGSSIDSGHVRIFNWNGSAWMQLGADIDGEFSYDYDDQNSGSEFSCQFNGNTDYVSLDAEGTTIAIGAYCNDGAGTNKGHVRVFHWDDSAWIQLGGDIDGEADWDYSGISVSLSADGKILAIGASLNDGNGPLAGHVRVYHWNGLVWDQRGNDIDGESAYDESGSSVSLSRDGSTVAIGAPLNDGNGNNSGHVRVFRWNGSAWIQRGEDIDGESNGDHSGVSVSLSKDGSFLAIGAEANAGNGVWSGHVRVYRWAGSFWKQWGSDIDSEFVSDISGSSVALSNDATRVAIGAFNNFGGGSLRGHTRIFDLTRFNCDGFALLLGWPNLSFDSIGGSISISGNGTGCSSNEEILVSAPYFLDYKMAIPATSCKASNPAQSVKLQSRESGLTNTEIGQNLLVTCPLNREVFTANTSKNNSVFNVIIKVNKSTADESAMDCTLSEYIGDTQSDSEIINISLNGTEVGFAEWKNWRPSNNLVNYAITCDLLPKTAITSIEIRTIY